MCAGWRNDHYRDRESGKERRSEREGQEDWQGKWQGWNTKECKGKPNTNRPFGLFEAVWQPLLTIVETRQNKRRLLPTHHSLQLSLPWKIVGKSTIQYDKTGKDEGKQYYSNYGELYMSI